MRDKRSGPAVNGAATKVTTGQQDHREDSAEAAEAALLGSLLLSPEACAGIGALVTADDFSRDAHRQVYLAVQELHAQGQPVDTVTVTDCLARRGQLDTAGGPLGVSLLASMEVCPVPASWAAYGTVVAREARRRRLVVELTRALRRLEAGEDPDVVRSEVGS